MEEKITREYYEKLYEKNEDGSFKNLVIHSVGNIPELDLRGKKPLECTLDEIVSLKKYAAYLLKQIEENEKEIINEEDV